MTNNPLETFNADELRIIAQLCRQIATEAEHHITTMKTTENAEEDESRRTPAFRSSMVGINPGSTLEYDDPRQGRSDARATVTTSADQNKDLLNGRIVTPSRAATLLSNQTPAQGTKYFLYNGERLTDMRSRMEGSDE